MKSCALTCLLTAHWNLCFGSEQGAWLKDGTLLYVMCFQAMAQGATCLITYTSLETLSYWNHPGMLFQGDFIALWPSHGTLSCLKGWHCLIRAVMVVETLTGPGKWMTVGSGFVFKHLITCMLWAAPYAKRSTALMLLPIQQVHGMKGAWHLSGVETPAPVELPTMSRTLLAGRMQPEIRSVCVFLPTREQLSLAVGVSGWEVAASRPRFSFVSSRCSPKSLLLVCWPKGY